LFPAPPILTQASVPGTLMKPAPNSLQDFLVVGLDDVDKKAVRRFKPKHLAETFRASLDQPSG